MPEAYDDQNIFAKILRGEIPCVKVYEDAQTLCFMDIMPRTDGHCLVIPKTPCRNMLDATPEQLAACMATVNKVANAAKRGFGADGITLLQFSEAAGGQEVFHLHFHIHPRHDGVPIRPPGAMGDMDVIKKHAEVITQALASS
ncbi:HIT family protein [Sulfitobacter sp. M57]|uniref:HIT family protein n=1 Tax=unclassified Sulfitobacter TaxID=196795 RepID=UPI0023E1324C|nr:MULTISPECIES: HIT family protein [unclassified Sulfitobacter]MDF3413868.1 HIT family protein [Sulfitobacter sp. KE5]MDF3420851.1 HIT family protein [Sulfitobacter sp. KE43]MDF3432414.1 HIT family protein [Sulfitobacter sp. KE42]MDF3458053.1 HIT family protein [Sulfitobacter sp. S74]MDF3461954.1 HIT family protein [Sulfitobacter sp. Ks18]